MSFGQDLKKIIQEISLSLERRRVEMGLKIDRQKDLELLQEKLTEKISESRGLGPKEKFLKTLVEGLILLFL